MPSRLKVCHLLVCVLVFTPLLTACNTGQPLPGGYAIFVASSKEIMLVDKDGAGVAGPHLDEVGNEGPFIFGHVVAMKGSQEGYFLFDSRDGTLKEGLGKDEWLTQLQAEQLATPPKLVYPGQKGPRY